MEPVTHLLTGACLARTGLNRRAAYATAAMTIAAEFPDIDTVWSLRGPVAGFEHHRGITHTFLGIPFEAAFLLLCFVLVHRFRSRKGKATRAPVRWGTLYGLLLLALLSHILLDYTNNYGVRPFFPFDPHWFAASIVFIFDPLLFVFLLAGLLLPGLFQLIGREVGTRRPAFVGGGWARAALVGVVLLWSVRWWQHGQAIALAQSQMLRAPATDDQLAQTPDAENPVPPSRPLLQAQRTLASPDPLSIFRWYTATDFGPVYQLGVAQTRRSAWTGGQLLAKPEQTAALRIAEATRLGQVYVDWSPMTVITAVAGVPDAADIPEALQPGAQTIDFTDLRFLGDTPLLRRGSLPPLTGQVILDRRGIPVAEGMDGRFGR